MKTTVAAVLYQISETSWGDDRTRKLAVVFKAGPLHHKGFQREDGAYHVSTYHGRLEVRFNDEGVSIFRDLLSGAFKVDHYISDADTARTLERWLTGPVDIMKVLSAL